MQDATVVLGGVDWQILFVNKRDLPKDHMGICYWDKKEIRIYKRLSRQQLLDTLIHEMRHAQHKIMFEAEEFIDSTSTELANGILKARIFRDGEEEA